MNEAFTPNCDRKKPEEGSFFAKPTRGGTLTIVNCLIWVVVMIGVATRFEPLQYLAIIVCWPMGLLLMTLGGDPDPVFLALLIGFNSLIWGYGISWLISLFEPRRTEPDETKRGFEVIMPKPVESIAPTPDQPSSP